MQIQTEYKTSFSDTPEGQGFCFPRRRASTLDDKVKETAEQTIKRLTEENINLRAEIKALKSIIKNINN